MSDEAIAAAKRIPAWPVPSEFRTEFHCPSDLAVPGWEEPEGALVAAAAKMEQMQRRATLADHDVAECREKLNAALAERDAVAHKRAVASEWFHETAKAVAKGGR